MKKQMTLYLLAVILAILPIAINGCGSGNQTELPTVTVEPINNPRDLFIAEEVTLPQEAIYGEKIYGDTLYYLNYVPPETAGTTSVYKVNLTQKPYEAAGIPVDIPAGQEVGKIAVDGEGGVHLLTYQYDRTGAEESIADAFWLKLAADGTVAESRPIGEYLKEQEFGLAFGFEIDEAGKAHVAAGNAVYVINQEGGLDFKADCGDQIFRLFKDEGEGTIYAQWNREGLANIAPIDRAGKTMGTSHKLAGMDPGMVIGMGLKAGGQLQIATESSVYRYNMGESKPTIVFDWMDLDLVGDYFDSVLPLSEQLLLVDRNGQDPLERTVLRIIRERTAEEQQAAEQARTAGGQQGTSGQGQGASGEEQDADSKEQGASGQEQAAAGETQGANGQEETAAGQTQGANGQPQPDGTAVSALPENGVGNITLGTASYLESGMKEAIVEFNQANPDTRIEIIDYSADIKSQEDYEESINRLNADIVSGNGPDLLILPPGFPLELYAGKGILTDLNPYFSSSLRREDYQENILAAYETDGQLYGLPVTFIIECLVGRAADLGSRTEWNMAEMTAFVDRFGESEVFYPPTKSSVMELCLMANGGCLIDWSGKGGGFKRDLLLEILEFSNRFTPDAQADTGPNLGQSIAEGKTRLLPSNASNIQLQLNRALFGEPVAFIGYPSESGNGLLISGTTLAINSKCAAKGTAWAFISRLLSAEVQAGDLGGSPVLKSALNERIEAAGKSDGSSVGMSGDGVSVNVVMQDATDEEIEALKRSVAGAENRAVADSQVTAIIMEEAGAYFNGSKTAAEAADIIENRVNLYVSEAR